MSNAYYIQLLRYETGPWVSSLDRVPSVRDPFTNEPPAASGT